MLAGVGLQYNFCNANNVKKVQFYFLLKKVLSWMKDSDLHCHNWVFWSGHCNGALPMY